MYEKMYAIRDEIMRKECISLDEYRRQCVRQCMSIQSRKRYRNFIF